MCAFDTKRFLLDNNADTLAYGHKTITHEITHEAIENPGADIILTAKQARDSGLVWSRRRGACKRLGIEPDDNGEETEKEALQAGKEALARMRKRLEDVEEAPDKLIPQEVRPGAPRKPAKRPRMRIDSDEESPREPTPNPDPQTEVALRLLFPENYSPSTPSQNNVDPFQRPHITLEQAADPNFNYSLIRQFQESLEEPSPPRRREPEVYIQNSTSIQTILPPTIPKSIEVYSGPKRAPKKKSSAVRSFFLEEAVESENEDDEESVPRRKAPKCRNPRSDSSDEDIENESDSDLSFIVGDDDFE